jgi:hypothetical protein
VRRRLGKGAIFVNRASKQKIVMSAALVVLLSLVSLCPAIITVDGPLLSCLIPLLVSVGLILVAIRLPTGEAQHVATVVSRPVVMVAAFPVIWMLIQILPLPFLENPVWTSVAAGFRRGISGSISVDIGATAIALVRYLSVAGAILLAASVTVNRERAELVLVGTTAATALISFVVICHDFFGVGFLVMHEEALDCSCLGVVLATACACLVFERSETRRSIQTRSKFLFSSLACLIAFIICAGAVAGTRSGSLAFAAGSGFLTFCAAVTIRRWALGRLGAAAIGVTATVIAVTLVTIAATDPDPRFAFVKRDAAAVELTQRILSDAPFFGDGAGSFRALLPIYQSPESDSGDSEAVTAAAKLSIEMGKAMLWVVVVVASFSVFALLRGASHRGRDSFYAAAAGPCLVTLMNLAFVNVGLFGSAILLLSATIMGLGLTQSRSRAVS